MPKRPEPAAPHVLGIPARPKGDNRLTKAEYPAWNKLCAELLVAGKLYLDDGDLIRQWLQARAEQYKAAGKRSEIGRQRAAELQAMFNARQPAPNPAAPAPVDSPQNGAPAASLEQFLAAVRNERATFASRMVPGTTLTLDASGQYLWPEGDAATVARDYCLGAVQGQITVCELTRRACARHLSDLDNGSERGLYFDVVAARLIVEWFRDFIGLRLEPWEVFIVTSIFAWKHASGLRRFQEAWISVAKKNGKTAICSGVGLFGLVADQEKFADVFSAATKKEQARLIFRDAVRAVHANPELKEYVREFKTGSLVVEETDSTFSPLSSDTKSMDGLRPHFCLCDEIHEWESREQFDKLTKGVVSRPQPLIFEITTAGETPNCFAYSKNALAEKILNGVADDDTTFCVIYQVDPEDDFKDEKNWPKANPNLGISLQASALRKIFAEAEQDPAGQVAAQRYHANRWVSFRQGRSIPAAKWDACRGMEEAFPNVDALTLRKEFLAAHCDQSCWAGLDLGGVSDLSSFVILFPRAEFNGRNFECVTAVPYFWMPEYGLLDKEKAWGVPLSAWVRAGWIKALEGDICDPRVVRDDIIQLCLNGPGKIRSIGYDPWQTRTMMAEISEQRVAECVAVPQKPSELTIPCRELKQHIWEKRFWHLNNPVARWMFGNLVIEPDEATGGMRPKKLSRDEKIDMCSATATAWHRLLAAPTKLQWDGVVKFI